MTNINNHFLEEFKRLDKLCRDIYQDTIGVTHYINDMQNTAPSKSRYIADWDIDLKTLKRLRHIRNQLSHEIGTFNIAMCTLNDIRWLQNFHMRIMNCTDPISLSKKLDKPARTKIKNSPKRKKRNFHHTVIFTLLILCALAAIFIYLRSIYPS